MSLCLKQQNIKTYVKNIFIQQKSKDQGYSFVFVDVDFGVAQANLILLNIVKHKLFALSHTLDF
jgi:hypothetical protein